MVQNLYLCVVVVFRAVGLYLVGSVLLGVIFGVVLAGRAPFLSIVLSTAPMLLSGVLLWILAKPAARLITSGLEN